MERRSSVKDINIWIFIAGLFLSFVVGIITFFIFNDLIFSGLCIVATAILFSHSLETNKEK